MRKALQKLAKETARYIDRETYLQALGLHTLGRKHFLAAFEAEAEMNKVLGIEDDRLGGHLSDSIAGERFGFDEALKRERFVVRSKKPKTRR